MSASQAWEMSQRQPSSNNATNRFSGFTLIEVMVSIAILAVGLLGVAALISSTMSSGTSARFVNMANVLASEKLDGLNKWPASDPNVACATTTCGSLTGTATCASGDAYCDEVTMTESAGADYETQTQIVDGTAQTTTIVHTNTGCVDTPTNCGVPDPTGGGSTFTRRWLITMSPTISTAGGATATVTGSRRITVIVNLNDLSVQPPVSFQMSMVRP